MPTSSADTPYAREVFDVAVLGAGPAGLAAAGAAATAGARVALIDAGRRTGGQYWRHREGDDGSHHTGWSIFAGLTRTVEGHGARIEHLAGHSIWQVETLPDGGFRVNATVDDGEIWLRGLHIPEYTQGSWTNHAPRRTRKLLLHRSEIERLIGKTREGSLTLVPLSMYFENGYVKVELALAKGKQAHDKRQDLAKRDMEREVTRELGRRVKGMH